MSEQKSVQIAYIGKKEVKKDTVNGTGTVWFGNGDIQPYPAQLAARLLSHAAVWMLASQYLTDGDKGPAPDPEDNSSDYETDTDVVSDATAAGLQIQRESDEDDRADEEARALREGLANASKPALPAGEPTKQPEGEGEGEGEGEAEGYDLLQILRDMPRDGIHVSKTGNPFVAKVRELANDPELTTEEVKEAWAKIKTEG